MIIKLYIGNQRLDLFEDESINLNSSIANVSDITKNTTEYTKSFTVPASDNNNIIFKHYYDFNIDNGFDARIKQDGYIELDGIPFKVGKFRLNSVSIKQGRPVHYNINFWGNLVTINDLFGGDKLDVLDLSAYDYEYNSTTVKTGLQNSLDGSGDFIYSLFANRQYYYNSSSSDNTNADTLTNIAFNGQNVGIKWNDIRPSIRVIKIIEAMESKYGITFSRDYFGRAEFTELYLYLNNTTEENTTKQLVDWNAGENDYIDFATDTGTYPINISTYRWRFDVNVVPDSGFENANYTVIGEVNGEEFRRQSYDGGNNTFTFEVDRTQVSTTEISVKVYVESFESFDAGLSIRQRYRTNGQFSDFEWNTLGDVSILSEFTVSNNVPDIEVMEFFVGLIKRAKLVVIPQDDGTIYVNTIDGYYASGKLLNITEYVDNSEIEISRGDILNPINFKFQEPKTLLNLEYKNNNNRGYGDLDAVLTENEDGTGDRLDGVEFTVELPFEQIVYEKLIDLNDNVPTNIVYAGVFDESISPVTPSAHIHYNYKADVGSKTVGFVNDDDSITELSGTINLPSHSYAGDNNVNSTTWGEEVNEITGNTMLNTMYSNYYANYISSIFNIKRRNSRYRVKNFPLRLLTTLDLNDVIQIRDNYYRIDNYNLDLLTGDIEFNLINSFDNSIAGFFPDKNSIVVDYQIQSDTIYVTNGSNISVNEVDTGFGVDWLEPVIIGNLIRVDFTTENNTGFDRLAQLNVVNNDTLQEFDVDIRQTPKRITADNNIITSDVNNITADNN